MIPNVVKVGLDQLVINTIMEEELKKQLGEYLLKLSNNGINVGSAFARDMMVLDILEIIKPFLKEQENINTY